MITSGNDLPAFLICHRNVGHKPLDQSSLPNLLLGREGSANLPITFRQCVHHASRSECLQGFSKGETLPGPGTTRFVSRRGKAAYFLTSSRVRAAGAPSLSRL